MCQFFSFGWRIFQNIPQWRKLPSQALFRPPFAAPRLHPYHFLPPHESASKSRLAPHLFSGRIPGHLFWPHGVLHGFLPITHRPYSRRLREYGRSSSLTLAPLFSPPRVVAQALPHRQNANSPRLLSPCSPGIPNPSDPVGSRKPDFQPTRSSAYRFSSYEGAIPAAPVLDSEAGRSPFHLPHHAYKFHANC